MRLAPHTMFMWSLTIFAVCTLASVWFITNTPWIGFTLALDATGNLRVAGVATDGPASGQLHVGEVVTAIHRGAGQDIQLNGSDILREPDQVPGYSVLNGLLSDLNAINAVLRARDFSVRLAGGASLDLRAEPRTPLSAVSGIFWYQLFWAALSFLLVASAWSFRPDSPTTRYFAISGLALSFTTLCSAIYSARGLGMDGSLVAGLLSLAHLSLYLGLASLLSLCWAYPSPLPALGIVSRGFFIVAILWWIVNLLRILHWPGFGPAVAQVLTGVTVAFVILMRWRRRQAEPEARHRTVWLWGAVAGGTVLYLILYPASLLVLGHPLVERYLAATLLHLIYLGLGIGIYLRTLFQMNRWVWSAWVFVGVSAAMLLLDMLTVYVLELQSERVLAVSVILMAWLYFPIRQLLWVRWSGRLRRGDYRNAIPGIVEELLAIQEEGHHQENSWVGLLQRLWAPLNLDLMSSGLSEAALQGGGAELHIPRVPGASAAVLRYADRGSRLFSLDDAHFADTLVLLAHRIALLKDAARSGALAERRRVASDLHDNVAPPLLSFVYRADQTRAAGAGRTAIRELRQIIQSLEVASDQPGLAASKAGP